MLPLITVIKFNKKIMELEALKFIGIGLCSFGMMGAALAVGNIFSNFFNAISRNPSAAPKIEKYVFIAAGLAEAMGIFAFLVVLMLLFL